MNQTPLKTCPRCGDEKPATREYFYQQTRRRDGLSFWCKSCAKEMRRKPQIINPKPGKVKACRTCKGQFPATTEYFSKNPWLKDGLHSRCKKCRNSEHRQKNESAQSRYEYECAIRYFAENPNAKPPVKPCTICGEKLPCTTEFFYADRRAFDGLYGHCKKCHNDYTKENYRSNRKKKGDWHKQYRQENMEAYRAYTQNRIARKASLPNDFSGDDWIFSINYFEGRCAVCGRSPGFFHKLQADHWIPLSDPDCPGTVPRNIIPLCGGFGGCNQHKHAK